MLSKTQKAELRRILGFPNLGSSASVSLGYPGYASPFAQWQPYAWLERRMIEMSTDEEVELFGAESTLFGAYFVPSTIPVTFSTIAGLAKHVVLELDLYGELFSLDIPAGTDPTAVPPLLSAAIRANATSASDFFVVASGATLSLSVRALGQDGNGRPLQISSSDPGLLLQLSPVAIPSQYGYGFTAGGSNPPGPSMQVDGETRPTFGYVPIVRLLESDIAGARDNLDIQAVEGYTPRVDEMQARAGLLRRYRREIADRLNVPLDPDLVGNRRSALRRRI